MDEITTANVRVGVIDDTNAGMAALVNNFKNSSDRLAEALLKNIKNPLEEIDKQVARLHQNADQHINKGFTDAFRGANESLKSFTSGLTGLGGLLTAAGAGIFAREAIERFANVEEGMWRISEATKATVVQQKAMGEMFHQVAADTGEDVVALEADFLNFATRTSIPLDKVIDLFPRMAAEAKLVGTDISTVTRLVGIAVTSMHVPIERVPDLLDGWSKALKGVEPEFEGFLGRTAQDLEKWGMTGERNMADLTGMFVSLSEALGGGLRGARMASQDIKAVLDNVLNPLSTVGMMLQEQLPAIAQHGTLYEKIAAAAKLVHDEGGFDPTAQGELVRQWLGISTEALEMLRRVYEDKTGDMKKRIEDVAKAHGEVDAAMERHRKLSKAALDELSASWKAFSELVGSTIGGDIERALARILTAITKVNQASVENIAKWARNKMTRAEVAALEAGHPYLSEQNWEHLGIGADQGELREHVLNQLLANQAAPGGVQSERMMPPGHQTDAEWREERRKERAGQRATRDEAAAASPPSLMHRLGGRIGGFLGLQDGGIVQKRGVYELAEAGPEAVIPVDRIGQIIQRIIGPVIYAALEKAAREYQPGGMNAVSALTPGSSILGMIKRDEAGGNTIRDTLRATLGIDADDTKENTQATRENTAGIKYLSSALRPGHRGSGMGAAYTPGAGEAPTPAEAGLWGNWSGGGGTAGVGYGAPGGGYGAGPGGGGGTVPPIMGGRLGGGADYPSGPGGEGATYRLQDRSNTSIPASMRYNNPGAQWPSEESRRFGQTDEGVIGGGNKIAGFPTPIHGLASNIALLQRRGGRYLGHTIGQAISTWSGGHRSSVPGFDSNQIITPELANDPKFLIPFMKAMAEAESGRKGTISDQQISTAIDMVAAGSAAAYERAHPDFVASQGGKMSEGQTDGSTVGSTHGGQAGLDEGLRRYSHLGGDLTMDGQHYGWGSGGAGGGSLPLGDYYVNMGPLGAPGGGVGPLGQSGWGGKLPPAVAGLNTQPSGNLSGFEIHMGSSNDLNRLYSAGCFAIAPRDWPAFRQALLVKAQREGKLMLHVHRGPGGRPVASITSSKDGKIVDAGNLTSGGLQGLADPGPGYLRQGGHGDVRPIWDEVGRVVSGAKRPASGTRPFDAKVGETFMPDFSGSPSGDDIEARDLPPLPGHEDWEAHPELAGRNRSAEPEMGGLDRATRRRIAEYQRRERDEARAAGLTAEEAEYDRLHYGSLDAATRRRMRANAARSRPVPLPRSRPIGAPPRAAGSGAARVIPSRPVGRGDGAMADPGGEIALAEGGIVPARPGGTRVVLGEAGQDEAVIPLGASGGFGLGGSEEQVLALHHKLRREIEHIHSRPIRMNFETPTWQQTRAKSLELQSARQRARQVGQNALQHQREAAHHDYFA